METIRIIPIMEPEEYFKELSEKGFDMMRANEYNQMLYREKRLCAICKYCDIKDDENICRSFSGDGLHVEKDFTCNVWEGTVSNG